MRYKSNEWFLYGRNTDFKLVHDLKNLVMKSHIFYSFTDELPDALSIFSTINC